MELQQAFERALAFDESDDIAAAIACLDSVAHAIPETAGHLKFAAQLYQRLGADRQSLALLNRALAVAPEDADLHLSLGYHHVDNGAPERALDCFRRYMALRPDSPIGQLYLGRALDWIGRTEAAEAELAKAVALDPASVAPHLQLGRTLTRLGRYAAAEQEFAAADALEPGNVLAEIGCRRARALATSPERKATSERAPATVVCVKAGTKYGADYVNRLASMVCRNTAIPPRFVCFTEDTRGLAAGINAHPLPAEGLSGWWNKVALFQERLPGVTGRILYLDLDVVITGTLDPLLRHGSDFVLMDNGYVPGFNSSVMLFEAGSRPAIWNGFSSEIAARLEGDQDWLGLTAPDADLWPEGWCVPFRLRAAKQVPSEAKVVVFSGRPNPDDYPADWVRELWR